MTPDEQEALSHQHSHGFWLVPLSSGVMAVFDHPNGSLLGMVNEPWGDHIERSLQEHGEEAAKRHESRKQVPVSLPALPLDLKIEL